MKTIGLKIGDTLRVKVDAPLAAGLRKGDIVRVIGFQIEGTPVVSNVLNRKPDCSNSSWFCHPTKFFHHYQKTGREGTSTYEKMRKVVDRAIRCPMKRRK